MNLYWNVLTGLPTTLALCTSSMLIGAVAGIPVMLARRSPWLLLRIPARLVIDVFRAVPPLVWLFVIFFGLAESGLTLTPFTAATVGLGAISAAYLAEVYRGGLMAIDKGQWEAGQALGLNIGDMYRFVLGPQAFRAALPAMASYTIALTKDTALAYTIGVEEILFKANHLSQVGAGSSLSILGFAGALYAVLSVATAYVARRLDSTLRAR